MTAPPREPVLPCVVDGCGQPSMMPMSEYCLRHSCEHSPLTLALSDATSAPSADAAQPAEPPAQDADRVPNDDEVICPGCTHQFRAVPVNVQADFAALYAENERQAREIADGRGRVDYFKSRLQEAIAKINRMEGKAAHWYEGEIDKERRRAERAEADLAAVMQALGHSDVSSRPVCMTAQDVVADRDALRECVRAADAMRLGLDCPMCDSGKLRNPVKEHWDTCAFSNYDAARAKVKL